LKEGSERMENEKRLIEKCYEEVEKYLNGEYHKEKRIDSYKFPFNKISRIMNILATLRLSKYRDKITEEKLINKIYEVLIVKIDENDFEMIQRCANLLNLFLYKDEHLCI